MSRLTGLLAIIYPATGIVSVPGRRLAVLRAADGNLPGLMQQDPPGAQ